VKDKESEGLVNERKLPVRLWPETIDRCAKKVAIRKEESVPEMLSIMFRQGQL